MFILKNQLPPECHVDETKMKQQKPLQRSDVDIQKGLMQ